jgi:Ca2+-binding RTX toxin-like protein
LPHVYRDDHPRSGTPSDILQIKVTLTDAGGLLDHATAAVTVNNAAPVISSFTSGAALASPAVEGAPVDVAASFSDAGTADTHVAVVNWGDGSAPESVALSQGAGTGTVAASHAYAAGGIYMITLTVTDDDTGAASATATAVVSGIGLSNGTLFVVGSPGNDRVDVNQTANGTLKARASFIREDFRAFNLAAVGRIIAYLGDGDDHLTISSQVKVPAVIHGGPGADHLNSGGAPAALLGDQGDDHLLGGAGRTILIGGGGRDVLTAGAGGDVLLGGSANVDGDDDTLLAAATTWSSEASYPARVSAIRASVVSVDDRNEDRLTGGSGRELFFYGEGDVLTNRKQDELTI